MKKICWIAALMSGLWLSPSFAEDHHGAFDGGDGGRGGLEVGNGGDGGSGGDGEP